jgi:PAS domain-containing protein
MYRRESNFDFDALDADWNSEPSRAEVFQQIDAPLYTVDANGWLTYYNDAAAALWGLRPELGKARWCGAWCLYGPNGSVLPHDCCPIATALKERSIVRPCRMLLERPDETKVLVRSHPTLLRDAAGAVIAAFDILQPISQPETQGSRIDDGARPYSRWLGVSATAMRRHHV